MLKKGKSQSLRRKRHLRKLWVQEILTEMGCSQEKQLDLVKDSLVVSERMR